MQKQRVYTIVPAAQHATITFRVDADADSHKQSNAWTAVSSIIRRMSFQDASM
jgi:hypothetical protein